MKQAVVFCREEENLLSAQPLPTAPLRVRVFLASPGDVTDERALALRVLERLPYDVFLRERIAVETVAWDKPGADTPMLATMTPQEAIAQQLAEAEPVPRTGQQLVECGLQGWRCDVLGASFLQALVTP